MIRDARFPNISLLGKLVGNLVVSANKPWVHILRHKYLHNCSIFECNNANGASYVWRSILKELNEVRESWEFKLYDGSSLFWYDDWTGQGPLVLES